MQWLFYPTPLRVREIPHSELTTPRHATASVAGRDVVTSLAPGAGAIAEWLDAN